MSTSAKLRGNQKQDPMGLRWGSTTADSDIDIHDQVLGFNGHIGTEGMALGPCKITWKP